MRSRRFRFLPGLCLVAAAAVAVIASAHAQPTAPASQSQPLPRVEGAWVRSAVPGQHATGAFMKITAPRPMQLVGVATPVAGVAEVHEMKMEGDVMKMRAVPALDLPAGRAVELKPGGYHLMLMELKQPLEAGSTRADHLAAARRRRHRKPAGAEGAGGDESAGGRPRPHGFAQTLTSRGATPRDASGKLAASTLGAWQ